MTAESKDTGVVTTDDLAKVLDGIAEGTVSAIGARTAVQKVCASAGKYETVLVITAFLGGLALMGETRKIRRVEAVLAELDRI